MFFELFNLNFEVSITKPYVYEVLVYPSDINGEIDDERYFAYCGGSRLEAYYTGWKKARIEAQITGRNHDFTIRYTFEDLADSGCKEDWEFLVSRTIEARIKVAFFSK